MLLIVKATPTGRGFCMSKTFGCTPLPGYIGKSKVKRRDVLSAAKLALRYLHNPEVCETEGVHLADVIGRLDEAIKAAEVKLSKRQLRARPYDENIVF